jgi:hypothetical protein
MTGLCQLDPISQIISSGEVGRNHPDPPSGQLPAGRSILHCRSFNWQPGDRNHHNLAMELHVNKFIFRKNSSINILHPRTVCLHQGETNLTLDSQKFLTPIAFFEVTFPLSQGRLWESGKLLGQP